MKDYFFNRPFPFPPFLKLRLKISFAVSFFLYAFLLLAQPFAISQIKANKAIYLLGYFAIILFVLVGRLGFLPLVAKKFYNAKNWTLSKMIYFISTQYLLASILIWYYDSTIGKEITTQTSLLNNLFYIIIIGILPSLFVLVFIENKLRHKHEHIAQEVTEQLHSEQNINQTGSIRLTSKNKDENIELGANDIICLKAEGNYIKVFYVQDGKTGQHMIRNSLSNIERQFIEYHHYKRCHRSYIVNFNQIDEISGNARNYNLHFKNLDFSVPVSRSFPHDIIIQMKSSTS